MYKIKIIKSLINYMENSRSCSCFTDYLLSYPSEVHHYSNIPLNYEGWNFNIGNYLFTTDTK